MRLRIAVVAPTLALSAASGAPRCPTSAHLDLVRGAAGGDPAQRRRGRGDHRRRAGGAAGAAHDPHPVYVDETSIQYLENAAWVEQPGALFARLIGETIAARTGRVVLDPSQYSHDPGTRLTGTLVKFGLDPAAMQVVIVYDAAVARGATGVTTNRFEARVAVADATPAVVAPALNQAANQLAGEVAAWVGN